MLLMGKTTAKRGPPVRRGFNAVAALLVASCVLTSCATTVHETVVNYHYDKVPAVDLSGSDVRLRVGDVLDGRGNPDPRMILNGFNLNGGRTTGGWRAEKPVAGIVRDALVAGLESSHARVVTSGETAVLKGTLVSYTWEWISGGFFTATTITRMVVNLSLVSSADGALIWHDSFKVTDNVTASVTGPRAPTPDALIRTSLDKLVQSVLSDQDFVHRLREFANDSARQPVLPAKGLLNH
jgi:hypothetical protein